MFHNEYTKKHVFLYLQKMLKNSTSYPNLYQFHRCGITVIINEIAEICESSGCQWSSVKQTMVPYFKCKSSFTTENLTFIDNVNVMKYKRFKSLKEQCKFTYNSMVQEKCTVAGLLPATIICFLDNINKTKSHLRNSCSKYPCELFSSSTCLYENYRSTQFQMFIVLQ
jgi:hypothetical protein